MDGMKALHRKADRILELLEVLVARNQLEFTITMKTLADLTADVAAEKTVEQSAVTLLGGLSAQIAALKTEGTDPATAAQIDALAASVEGQTADLSSAVTANTPAAPEPQSGS